MTQAVVLTPGDFDKFISEMKAVVREEMRGYVSEEPITFKQAAAYLMISERTLHERFQKGLMPASLKHHVGGTVYLFASELEQYVKNS